MIGASSATRSVSAPAAPSDLRSIVYSSTAGAIAWDRASTAGLRYEVSRGGEVVATTDGTSHVDRTLEGGRTYPYSVIAIDPDGRRSAPSRIEVRTDGETPLPGSALPAPANLRVEIYPSVPGGARQAALFWDQAATPGLRYEVQRNGSVFETTRQTSYYFEWFADGTDFTFDIVAFDGERQSPPARVTLRLPPRSPLPERSDEPDAIDLASDRFAPERGLVVTSPVFVAGALGDIDGDALADVLFAAADGGAFVLPGRARGAVELDPHETSMTGGSGASTIDDLPAARKRPISGLDDVFVRRDFFPIGDVNGDGRADLHTPEIQVRVAEDEVGYVILDAFATADPLSLGNLWAQPGFPLVSADGVRRRSFAIGDFDGDGVDDFALSNVFSVVDGASAIVYGSRNFR